MASGFGWHGLDLNPISIEGLRSGTSASNLRYNLERLSSWAYSVENRISLVVTHTGGEDPTEPHDNPTGTEPPSGITNRIVKFTSAHSIGVALALEDAAKYYILSIPLGLANEQKLYWNSSSASTVEDTSITGSLTDLPSGYIDAVAMVGKLRHQTESAASTYWRFIADSAASGTLQLTRQIDFLSSTTTMDSSTSADRWFMGVQESIVAGAIIVGHSTTINDRWGMLPDLGTLSGTFDYSVVDYHINDSVNYSSDPSNETFRGITVRGSATITGVGTGGGSSIISNLLTNGDFNNWSTGANGEYPDNWWIRLNASKVAGTSTTFALQLVTSNATDSTAHTRSPGGKDPDSIGVCYFQLAKNQTYRVTFKAKVTCVDPLRSCNLRIAAFANDSDTSPTYSIATSSYNWSAGGSYTLTTTWNAGDQQFFIGSFPANGVQYQTVLDFDTTGVGGSVSDPFYAEFRLYGDPTGNASTWQFEDIQLGIPGAVTTAPVSVRLITLDQANYTPTINTSGDSLIILNEFAGGYFIPSISPFVSSGGTITVATAYGMIAGLAYDNSDVTGSFDLTDAYSIYALTPEVGTNRYAGWFDGVLAVGDGNQLRIYPTGDDVNYTSFEAGTQVAPISYTLPTVQGGASEVLSNDGAGILSWVPMTGGGGGSTTGGTTIKGGVIIASDTLLSDSAIDIQNISTDYDWIEITAMLRSTDTSYYLDGSSIYFNNDTTATNYQSASFYSGTAVAGASAADISFAGTIVADGSGGTVGATDYFSVCRIIIGDPGGSKFKIARCIYGTRATSANVAGDDQIYSTDNTVHWENTAAITRITLRPLTGTTFKTGSKYQIIGYKTITVGVGPMGPQGIDGEDGEIGGPGPPGPVGATGATGATGSPGPAGVMGLPGEDGEEGLVGPPGAIGPAGATGAVGSPGPAGFDGEDGEVGPTGRQGDRGLQGLQGIPGDAGEDASDGLFGPPGPVGPQGSTGAAGPAGAMGIQGETGDDGEPGVRGPEGGRGLQGLQGMPGSDGEDGSDGIFGIPGPIGATGATGSQGPVGPAIFLTNEEEAAYPGLMGLSIGGGTSNIIAKWVSSTTLGNSILSETPNPDITIAGSFLPSINQVWDLGSQSGIWNAVWCAEFRSTTTMQLYSGDGIGGYTSRLLLRTSDANGDAIAELNRTSFLKIRTGSGLSNAPELQLFEPGAGANYTAFKAQAQAADITYTLPAAAPTITGQVLSSTTGGTLSWTSTAGAQGAPGIDGDDAECIFQGIPTGYAVRGNGTLNTIPKWTPDGFTLGNSILADTGVLTATVSQTVSSTTRGFTLTDGLTASAGSITLGGFNIAGTVANNSQTSTSIRGYEWNVTMSGCASSTITVDGFFLAPAFSVGSTVGNFAVINARPPGTSFTASTVTTFKSSSEMAGTSPTVIGVQDTPGDKGLDVTRSSYGASFVSKAGSWTAGNGTSTMPDWYGLRVEDQSLGVAGDNFSTVPRKHGFAIDMDSNFTNDKYLYWGSALTTAATGRSMGIKYNSTTSQLEIQDSSDTVGVQINGGGITNIVCLDNEVVCLDDEVVFS